MCPVPTFRGALAASRAGFEIKRIGMADALPHWTVQDGAIQHRSRGFFSIAGVEDGNGREHVMLYQPQGAVNGLYTARYSDQRWFLLQARAEPGNVDAAQVGPSLQSTPANFLQFHGGRTSDFFQFFLQQHPDFRPVEETTQLDLGTRYLFKTKRTLFAEGPADVAIPPGFFWISSGDLLDAARESYTLNTDMRAFLSILSWSSDLDDGEVGPRQEDLRRSLTAPVRPERIGSVLRLLAVQTDRKLRFKPLDALANWRLNAWGLEENVPRERFAAHFFKISARMREVDTWVQPLITSNDVGTFGLLTRERNGYVEVFVRVIDEIGLVGGRALAPSWLFYPGQETQIPGWLEPHFADVWAATEESDEGGRFFQHKSRVAILRTTNAPMADDATTEYGWLRLSELQLFLRRSNVCTIQIRIAASLLLGIS